MQTYCLFSGPNCALIPKMLATGVYSYHAVSHLISFYFLVIFYLHQPIHEAQIYFVFLSGGNPKTVLKGGYSGWLCKLFDKALVIALVCGALAMCLQNVLAF
jgi:hypothetical protein